MPALSQSASWSNASPTPTRTHIFTLTLYNSDIAANKEHAVQQMNFVHQTLDAFEKDFVDRLNTLGDNLKSDINEEG